jgi:Peptidase family M28
MENEAKGWLKLMNGYPWFNCDGCYPLPAYSEFMPSPLVGRKLLGEVDYELFDDNDPYGWHITEMEEEYELRPGIVHTGHQIMNSLMKLGKGLKENHIHGHGGQNLKDNPYWPPELASRAGSLLHERYVTLLPMMLSRTQDDKGRVTWTFFGNSIDDPERTFWKSFYNSPDEELPSDTAISFFISILIKAFGVNISGRESLINSGFRILPVGKETILPGWTKEFLVNDSYEWDHVKYLLTFRPFASLPAKVKELYLSGNLNLLPFPGSLVFWGMPNYLRLKKEMHLAGQIPLLNIVARNRGIGGLRVTQSGWLHEPHIGNVKHEMNEELIVNTFHRTNRWQRIHRYQDELNQIAQKIKIAKALFSTDPEAIGLYDKPLARNSHIWTHDFKLLLDGPKANHRKIQESEKEILQGGLFGYRFFYPPMKVGYYDIYWHRPLVAYLSAKTQNIEIESDTLQGYLTGYHRDDKMMAAPIELWPRFLRRELYLMALHDFNTANDHFNHQTSKNILSLFDSYLKQGRKPLTRSYAHKLINIAKHKTFQQWLDDLINHSKSENSCRIIRQELDRIIENDSGSELSGALTYDETATRSFEENWWNDIKFLAHGDFVYKDNADIVSDANQPLSHRIHRDLENVGDYFMSRHQKAISDAGMEGIAECGELAFKWQTDFDFAAFGGWASNQKGVIHERNILVVIPGKNRKEVVVLGDHYDTAYMEDIYEKSRGGTGIRQAANGADDNYSASATLLQAAPIFLKLSKEGKLERDIWLLHLTGEEFPSDCMGARNFCRTLIENNIKLTLKDGSYSDLSGTDVKGVFVMDMIGHNRDKDQNIFQISPGKSAASIQLAAQAHLANMIWNTGTHKWNQKPERIHLGRGKRITGDQQIPELAKHLAIEGEVRTQFNPHSSIFNTDGQIFSDVGLPIVLFMENYDINRTGYHDTKDTMENIDLDYGAAFAAIAIETIARMATIPVV